MNKIIVFFFLITFVFGIIDGIYQGGGVATSYLTSNISATATQITVRNSEGYLKYGTVTIGNEIIKYSGIDEDNHTFEECERGYQETVAYAHSKGSYVYSDSTAFIEGAAGFSVTEIKGTAGVSEMAAFAIGFVTRTIPRAISMNYSFFEEPGLQYVKYFMFILSAAFVFVITYYILLALGNMFSGVLSRLSL